MTTRVGLALFTSLLATACSGDGGFGRRAGAPTILPAAQHAPLFDAYLDLPLSMDAEWVELVDVNQDGVLDQLVAVQCAGTVAVLEGYGDGTFAPARYIEVGPLPTCIVAEDLNGDGLVDMTVATTGDGRATTWLGDGQGGFEREQSQQVFTESRALYEDEKAWFDVDRIFALEILRSGDLTGDGISDLVAGRPVFANTMGEAQDLGQGAALLVGRGDGSFAPPAPIETGGHAVGLELVDLDEDGLLDLAVAHRLENAVVTFRNTGGGTLVRWSEVAVGKHPVFLEAGDLDLDGHQDLVVVNRASEDIGILRGGGDGTLSLVGSYCAGPLPEAVALADLDADGLLDIAVANGKSPPLLGYYHGLGGFRFTEVEEIPAGHCANHSAFGDLDRDGELDLVMANSSSRTTSVYLGQGGQLRYAQVYPTGYDTLASTILDWDSDGLDDVVLLHTQARHLSLLSGRGRPWPSQHRKLDLPGRPHDLAVLPSSEHRPRSLAVSLSAALAVVLLTPELDGTTTTLRIPLEGHEPLALAAGDLDGDGSPEIVFFDGTSTRLVVLGDDGAHRWHVRATFEHLEGRVSDLDVRDLDGDGTAEIVATLQMLDRVLVLEGECLSIRAQLVTGAQPVGLLLADLNGDGHHELITADIRANAVTIFPGISGGSFGQPRAWAACRHPTALTVGDADMDGKVDLAVSCLTGNATAILLGDGLGGFTRRQLYGGAFEPSVVELTDLDRDGKPDLLMGSGSYSFDRTIHPPPGILASHALGIAWGR